MDKQKEAEKLMEEVEQLTEEINVITESGDKFALEDKSVRTTNFARLKILEKELESLYNKTGNIADDKLGENYDNVIKLHKNISEMRSIARTLWDA